MLVVLQLGLAAWMVYEAIRAVTPVPAVLQLVLVVAACYGLTYCPPIVLTVLDAAAVTATVRLIVSLVPRPVSAGPTAMKRPRTQRIPRLP